MNRIKEVRKANGMRQIDFAKQFNIGQSTLSGWENGRNDPDNATMVEIAKYFNVSMDYLMGVDGVANVPGAFRATEKFSLPILGAIKCGYGGLAVQEIEGYESSDYSPDDHFWLHTYGDSMEPDIRAGDLVLIQQQEDVDSGDIAVVMVDGEEGTLKKVIKDNNTLMLVSINPAYAPRAFVGEAKQGVKIIGKAIEIKRKLR